MTPANRLDERLMAELYDEYGAALHAYAYGFLQDRGKAEDVVQEVMVRAWSNPRLVESGPMRGWLFTVARNILTDQWRAARARPREQALDAAPAAEPAAPTDDIERLVETWTMEVAMQRLSDDHRAVLVQTYLNGRSVAQAALALDIPEGTVKSRAYHAMRALRTILISMGVTR
jgi:RNA polymerase sigma-70 factor, ECF subfamily